MWPRKSIYIVAYLVNFIFTFIYTVQMDTGVLKRDTLW